MISWLGGKGSRRISHRKPVKQDQRREISRLSSEVLGYGITIAASTLLFGYLGSLAGRRLGAEDALTLVGGLIGAAAGFYSLYVHIVVRARETEEEEESE